MHAIMLFFKTAKVRNEIAVSCSRKGPSSRYPALICRKLNQQHGSSQSPEEVTTEADGATGCAASALHLLDLDQQTPQFSNQTSPNWELKRRMSCFHSLHKDKVPEAEGCFQQSPNQGPETFSKEIRELF